MQRVTVNIRTITLIAATTVLASGAAVTLLAFSLGNSRWASGPIVIEMQLGNTGRLIDGSAGWDECAIAALAEWNANLGGTGVYFDAVRGSTRTPAAQDSVNSVFWADNVFGTPIGNYLGHVSKWTVERDGIDEIIESDIIFNNAYAWNCYRGPLRFEDGDWLYELKRSALHKFGRTLGLRSPDRAGQDVDAVMNSVPWQWDTLQTDDIQGALTLYGVPVTGIPFPPRTEVFQFFLALENEYANTLGRSQTNQGFVDAEGSAVWFPEWLRYVLNDCSATEASERVLLQIRGRGIQPVCGVVAEGTINFPPRDQSVDFLNTLDAFYRNELDRPVELSYIDLEGKAVWLQEYLRYRVNGCNNQEATDRVFQQIRGGAIAPVCVTADIGLTGNWAGGFFSTRTGTGTANVSLQASGTEVTGTWSTISGTGTAQGGTTTGTIIGTSVSLTLFPSVPTQCPYSVTATFTSTTVSGTWAAFHCTVNDSGTLNLTRQ